MEIKRCSNIKIIDFVKRDLICRFLAFFYLIFLLIDKFWYNLLIPFSIPQWQWQSEIKGVFLYLLVFPSHLKLFSSQSKKIENGSHWSQKQTEERILQNVLGSITCRMYCNWYGSWTMQIWWFVLFKLYFYC